MEAKKLNKGDKSLLKDYSHLDAYLLGTDSHVEVEDKINYLLSMSSICYDFNHGHDALNIFKKILNLALENETEQQPRYKAAAIYAAWNIQFIESDSNDSNDMPTHVEKVEKFYRKRFPFP